MNDKIEEIPVVESPRKQYQLRYNEFVKLTDISNEIKQLHLVIDEYNIDKCLIFVYDIIKKYFPNVKYTLLKKKIKDDSTDVVYAFKLDVDRPELYLIFAENQYVLVDQFRCEMYDDEARFIKPNWE